MITHDRWQRIKEIFHFAQGRTFAERSDFLNKVCGDDVSMREEVEALLTADASNENFLSAPAYEFAAGMLASEASEFSAGQKVGRYTILCSLGAGGMGQIYLAEDTQLRRKIALKLISREFATDPRRVHRFEQEARAASALNHPNVCVIHEIGITESARHFIAMEYIQGITLRDQLARGTLKPLEALQVAVQVGAALASAHAVGIVHRDIKPENIMLRPDGYVKVVDFGLAKLTEILPQQRHLDDEETKVRTEPRTLMGTVKYMSPEQLREAMVDERTDIWSLGIVLYEMLTGFTPFDARSRNDTIAMILASQPAKLLLDELPVKLREIVRRSLEKECGARYQTVTKLTSDLNGLKREMERDAESYLAPIPDVNSSLVPHPQIGTSRTDFGSAIFNRLKSQAMLTADFLFSEIRTHKKAALFAGASSVLALLFLLPGVARWLSGLVAPANSSPQVTKVAPPVEIKSLTLSGKSVSSAMSSDGRLLAHAEQQHGLQQLVVTNTATRVSFIAVPPDDVQYLGLTFSRDDNYLYFTRKKNHGDGNLYRLALPGANPIKLKDDVDSPISFSPQGDRFAFVRHDEATTEYSLILSNTDGTNEQVVASRRNGDTLSVYGLAWSPDASMVVCPTGHWDKGFHVNLVGFDLKNAREQVIGKSWASILQPAWQQDMTSLVISARERATTPHQLWRISFPDGTVQRITNDPDDYGGVSLSGDNIVTVRTDRSWDLWVLTPDELVKAKVIASGVGLYYGLSWTSKGKIVFSSMAPDTLNISRIDPNGSDQTQLTFDADNYTPASSPDGRFIVFASNRDGAFNIWRMNADDGSDLKQLTFSDANFYPSVSSDNQWVAYDNQVKTRLSIWKVPLNGGKAIKVGENYRMPVFSPDNQFIAGRYDLESGSRGVAIFSAQGGRPLRRFSVPTQEWQRIQWMPGGREVSYVKNEDGYSNIWIYNLDTGESRQVTNFNSDQIYAYAWSPDFKQLACQRGSKVSKVTMITGKR